MEQTDNRILCSDRMNRLQSGPVWKLLGMNVTEASEGRATVQLPLRSDLLQAMGHVHGGILMTILDSAMAAALGTLLRPGVMSVTAQLNTHFISPGSGPVLRATGKVVRKGAQLAVTEGKVFDVNDRLVAMASAQFFLTGSADLAPSGQDTGGNASPSLRQPMD